MLRLFPRSVLVFFLLLPLAACGENGAVERPVIEFTAPSANVRITTNNLLNRNLTVSGEIENQVANNLGSFQILNDMGVFPFPSPAPLPITPVGSDSGTFRIQLTDPLVNPSTPLLAGTNGNSIIVRAANQNSPLDQTGTPIASAETVRITIDNQIVFTNPFYATVTMGGTIDTACDLLSNAMMSGTFSTPAGTMDATTVISNAVVAARNEANRFADPTDDSFDEGTKPITVQTDGTFSVDIDESGWSGGYCPCDEIPADRNFLVRFETTSSRALPTPGSVTQPVELGTFPFVACDLSCTCP